MAKKDNIIMSLDEIKKFNKDIQKRCEDYNNLNDLSSFSKEKIQKCINKYCLPEFPRYENDIVYTKENTLDILDNLNLENITDNQGEKGIIIKRANLRAFPTNKHLYDNQKLQKFDTIQESELLVNTPVVAIHESKDKAWAFVISPFYMGWIEKENMAYASTKDWNYFINNQNFITITDKSYLCKEISLDMSVTLPLIKINRNEYEVALPTKDLNNMVTISKVTIPKNIANIGFLEYTYENLLCQAFKYKGSKYSWGGLDESVDCSSFVGNVYRCFGFYFPRNTSSQKISIGTSLSVQNKTLEEKRQIIENNVPCLLFRPGHVMLYIGRYNNKNCIIHASGQSLSVVISEVDTSILSTLDRIIIVK